MKSNWKNKVMRPATIFLMGLLFLVAACNNKDKHAEQVEYTCPMHPTVIQDHPGSCPVCGMELVRKGQPGEEIKITSELNYLLKPANAIITSSIQTVQPMQANMEVEVEANGIITYDTRRLSVISARSGGRIEKLYVKYNFQPVRKGQRLLELYSPELETARRELNYLMESDKDNALLIDAAKQKLRLLGVADSQIEKIRSQVGNTILIYSPVDGYIIEDTTEAPQIGQASSSTAGGMDGGMSARSSTSTQINGTGADSKELSIREGMYLFTGQTAFRVINTEFVWAEIDLYQSDASTVKAGDKVDISIQGISDNVPASIDFVQPFLRDGRNFIKLRVYLRNGKKAFRIGQLVTATVHFNSAEGLWIPTSASLDLGTRTIAFVKRRGVFRPTAISISHHSGKMTAITSGLDPSDSVASNAQFMVDSESFIKVRN